MIRVLLIDPFSGLAGDMLLAALIDAGASLDHVRGGLATLPLDGWELRSERVLRAGIAATKVRVKLAVLGGGEEGRGASSSMPSGSPHHGHGEGVHHHSHGGAHHHGNGSGLHHHGDMNAPHHGHRGGVHSVPGSPNPGDQSSQLGSSTQSSPPRVDPGVEFHHGTGHLAEHGRSPREILDIIARSSMSSHAKSLASAAFSVLAEAEANVHGTTVDQVHFHEVGAVDAIIDICGVALAVESLGIDRVHSSVVATGRGVFHCAHGELPIPGPATLRLLDGFPVRVTEQRRELVTPTGAALLRALSPSFDPPPTHRVVAQGYGAGNDDPPGRPNVVRVVVGELVDASARTDLVDELTFEVDDQSPEALAVAMDRLREHEDVLDASTSPCQMKKGRAGQRVCVIARGGTAAALAPLIFRDTSTFGYRYRTLERVILDRESRIVSTPFGSARVKLGWFEGRCVQIHPESDDVAGLATQSGVAFELVADAVRAAAKAATT